METTGAGRTLRKDADVTIVIVPKSGDRLRIHCTGNAHLVKGVFIEVRPDIDEAPALKETG